MTFYAKMAKAGINILSATQGEHNSTNYIFEYSWVDPNNCDKLKWSKANIWEPANHSLEEACQDIIAIVEETRQELEDGAE